MRTNGKLHIWNPHTAIHAEQFLPFFVSGSGDIARWIQFSFSRFATKEWGQSTMGTFEIVLALSELRIIFKSRKSRERRGWKSWHLFTCFGWSFLVSFDFVFSARLAPTVTRNIVNLTWDCIQIPFNDFPWRQRFCAIRLSVCCAACEFVWIYRCIRCIAIEAGIRMCIVDSISSKS